MNRRGLALVEVLVVTGVIFILATLSTGAFFNVRESARGSACRDHLGQIGKALHLYLQSNDDFYPPYLTGPRTVSGILSPPDTDKWMNALEPFGTRELWSCPNDPKMRGVAGSTPFFRSDVVGKTSYETCGSVAVRFKDSWPDGRVQINGTTLDRAFEGYVSDVWWDSGDLRGVVTVHGKRVNVLCHDGHVVSEQITGDH